MDASCCSTLVLRIPFLTIAASPRPLLHRLLYASWLPLLRIAVLFLPLIVGAKYSSDPSTNWALSDYYYNNVSESSSISGFRYSDFTVCANRSSYPELLNEEKGLYGRSTDIDSAHVSLQYAVYFSLYFVTAATESSCLNDYYNNPRYYLSLVALNTNGRDPNKGQVVWTANPKNPVTKNACLHLKGSNLRLVDYYEYSSFEYTGSSRTVWEVRTPANNISLAINFEGNIVLFSNTTDQPYMPLWESFQQPTDTLMVLQVLQNTSVLAIHSFNFFYGTTYYRLLNVNYTLALKNGRLVLYARIDSQLDDGENPDGSPYWSLPDSSVPANDYINFAAFCWDSINQLRLYAGSRSNRSSTEFQAMISPQFCSTIPSNRNGSAMQMTGSDQSINATFATFLRLEKNGDLRVYTVNDTTYPGNGPNWRVIYSVFNNSPCDLPLYCGAYGMCDPGRRNGNYCTCTYNVSEGDPRLELADKKDPQSGCILENRSIALIRHTCNNDEEVNFLTVSDVRYFSLKIPKGGVHDSGGCKGECERNCNCSAAFWNESGCFLVVGQLGTIQQQGSMQAFIKYVRTTSYSASHSRPAYFWKFLGSIIAITPLIACIILAYWQRRGAQEKSELQKERLLLLSLLDVDCANTEKFTWKQMVTHTKGFSNFLGGGGFGSVFRGALPDGTIIAVKKLDDAGCQGQGNKEFISEVSILSRIHHAHLVRLIGFCLEGMHRLLVYEYMENGSLDAWLFQNHVPLVQEEAHIDVQHLNVNEKHEGREPLPWKTRLQIALGTAKGLAYLHEECEERVIHMDLKPQNILLGRKFHPKISDFGMSKRTGREQSSVMTVMKGTPGYLAPEWLLDCAITEKCDVYSFGILLLEMVSGKKVKDLRALKQKLSMRPLRESVMLDLLDESLRYGGDFGSDVVINEKEAVRMVEVALLCVQTDPTKRPEMSSVVLMLEGREEVLQDIDALEDEEDDPVRLVQQHQVDESMESSTSGPSTIWISNSDYTNLSQKNSKRKIHKKYYVELQKQHLEL